ncbi:MAG: flagellar motor switch protein FliG [Chromatiales bacterium]|nr:flagellar motor switch protein FliG [Gammaproteobacteria bacterium]MCP5352478.1 flagellar motor switch protein FliG [Chromatiales bacterium]
MSEIKTFKTLTGVDRAAAFLMILNEREAADILKHMEASDIYHLANSMSNLPPMSKDQVKDIVRGFIEQAQHEPSLGGNKEAANHIRKLLILALGHDQANEVLSRIKVLDSRSGGIDALRRKDPREVADLVRHEHPQVTAIILSFLPAAHAANTLTHLSDATRQEVLIRIAHLEDVPISATEEINALIEAHFSDDIISTQTSSGIGGPKTAANILNLFEGSMQEADMASIRESDDHMAALIEENMLTFEDLTRIDDRAIQSLLGEVQQQTLMLALKGTGELEREKFLKNMSKRAADMLRDDLEVSGPVRLSEVETAQKEIVATARRMMENGSIVIAGVGGGEELVF